MGELVAKAKALAERYAVTYMDIGREINEAEQSLSAMIDDLTGDKLWL